MTHFLDLFSELHLLIADDLTVREERLLACVNRHLFALLSTVERWRRRAEKCSIVDMDALLPKLVQTHATSTCVLCPTARQARAKRKVARQAPGGILACRACICSSYELRNDAWRYVRCKQGMESYALTGAQVRELPCVDVTAADAGYEHWYWLRDLRERALVVWGSSLALQEELARRARLRKKVDKLDLIVRRI